MRFRFNLIKSLANLKIAILLLFVITSSSLIGSLIDQNESVQFYRKDYDQPEFYSFDQKLIEFFGFDHLFNTTWFVCLLLLFGLSLACCTFLQQVPMLKNARRIKICPTQERTRNLPVNLMIKSITTGRYIFALQKKNYQVFQSGGKFYAIKGLIGRVSPIIVHFSMILVLFGTAIAFGLSFVAQENIPETEIFHVQNLVDNNLKTYVPQFTARVNDFWIAYKTDLTTKQFYTDLSLIDINGIELKRETIYVNHPLKYFGLTFYQTDWNHLGARIGIDETNIYQLPLLKKNKEVAVSWFSPDLFPVQNQSNANGFAILTIANRGVNYIYDKLNFTTNKFELHESVLNRIQFLGFVNTAGLQIKADPGIFVIYFGFLLLIASTIISYTSFSQIWSCAFLNKFEVNGTSNRSKNEFEFEVLNLILMKK